jgi:tRNA 2-(methylsulfanyl)-N6-isopentenyladenosine37 hydroxylase
VTATPPSIFERAATLPLLSRTPASWAKAVLAEPLALLADHAFLEKKAALNAIQLLERWPNQWLPGWVETMTSVARDEAAHLAQVTRLLIKRGGRLERGHKNPYANALREMVRKGTVVPEALDRLFVSALIEARSCERFAVLAEAAEDPELAAFYKALFSSELGHFKIFLRLAHKLENKSVVEERWREFLSAEAVILAKQAPGPRVHSGY